MGSTRNRICSESINTGTSFWTTGTFSNLEPTERNRIKWVSISNFCSLQLLFCVLGFERWQRSMAMRSPAQIMKDGSLVRMWGCLGEPSAVLVNAASWLGFRSVGPSLPCGSACSGLALCQLSGQIKWVSQFLVVKSRHNTILLCYFSRVL